MPANSPEGLPASPVVPGFLELTVSFVAGWIFASFDGDKAKYYSKNIGINFTA